MLTDVDLLETATLGNVNWCSERFTIEDIRESSQLAHYTRLVPSRGDFGIVAQSDDDVLGVAWAQLFPPDDQGFAYIDAETPEVSPWVDSRYRGRGVGRQLLRALQTTALQRGIVQLVLSVEAENYAEKLYVSEGFVAVRGHEPDGAMVWSGRRESNPPLQLGKLSFYR